MSKTPSPTLSKPATFDARFADALRAAYALPWKGDIWDYLEKNCKLPHSVRTTRVDRKTSPWIIQPVREIFSRRKREQTVVGPVQGSKTAIIDLLIQYIVDQAPGETWLNMQKKEAADAVAEKRFMPMLEKNQVTARLLPTNPHKSRKAEIVFDHMSFKVQGATETNLQSSSIPWVLNDEVWMWDNVSLLEMGRKRIAAVWNGMMLNVSQGSVEGDHLDIAFKDGRMNEWGWTCPACKLWQPYTWFERDADDKPKPGGVRWDETAKRGSGDYDMEKVMATVHIKCANRICDFQIRDNVRERRSIADGGSYIAMNDNPHKDRDSWRWNAMTVYWIELALLVSEWITARHALRSGNHELLKLFKQQRLGQFWTNIERQTLTILKLSGYLWKDFTDGRKMDNEHLRFMTIDFQKHGLRVNIRAWRKRGLGSALIRYEDVPTFDDARALQVQYDVPNDCTFLDIRFNTAEGARQITRWQTLGQRGNVLDWGWTGLMGEDRNEGYDFIAAEGAKPVARPFSTFNYSQTEEGRKYRYILFSNLLVKDILHHHRVGAGNPWDLPADISESYKAQLDSEYRTQVLDKNGLQKTPRWIPLRKGLPNHSWDTEAHQIVAACITNLIEYSGMSIAQESPSLVDEGQS